MPHARVLTGGAGLGYVAAAAAENMGALDAPAAGAGTARIRAAYADEALQAVTWLAGAASLLCYCAFAVCLYWLVAGAPRVAGARVGLAGALLGVALAAVALVAAAPLVLDASGLDGDRAESLLAFYDRTRLASGAFMGLFLLGSGVAALRSAALPRPLAGAACAIAPSLLLAPLAAVSGDERVRVAAFVALGLHALWILGTGLWLALGPAELVRRSAFLVLALAAGLVGAALVVVPGASATFFAWSLAPAPLAAFAGGVYVASAAVYAAALRAPRSEVRGLLVAAAVLSTSVLAITLTHLDVFDFGRLQAWAWVVLFVLFGSTTVVLALRAVREPPSGGAPLPAAARVLLVLVTALLAPLAVALWVDPGAIGDAGPFELPPLGGRFAGSWVAMLAAAAGWAALRNACAEARYPALALVALPLGALAAAPRLAPDDAATYALALLLLSAAGAAVLALSRLPATARVAAAVGAH